MNPDLVPVLRCPACGESVSLQEDDEGEGRVRTGTLACQGCGAGYPIREGVPRFVTDDSYADNFSFEWEIHARTQLDTEENSQSREGLREKTGFTPDRLDGDLVLDAGVGSGRYAEVASRDGARVVGLDLSYSVDVARKNLAHRDNVDLVQGDLMNPPLAPEAFDAAYSIGVLHHTPDAKRAFLETAELVRPGGELGIWVYSGHNRWYRFSDIYRKVTTRLPKRFLYALSFVAVPAYHLYRIPILGNVLNHLLPLSRHPNWKWRVLDTYDWYSPRYQSKHTFPEVARWYRNAGFRDLRLFDNPPVGVSGRKTRRSSHPEERSPRDVESR